MSKIRKRYIAKLLVKAGELIQEDTDITVANIMCTVMRSINISDSNKDPYFMTDEDFSSALENTLESLKNKDND